MKVKLICDNCGKEFNGEEWMMDSLKEVLCNDCFRDLKDNDTWL